MKKCTKCGELKPLSEFYKDRTSKDGLSSWCGFCVRTSNREYNLGYYKEHRERILAYQHMYHQAHRERKRAYQRAYYLSRKGRAAHQRALTKRRKLFRAVECTLTADEWLEICGTFDGCAYCGCTFDSGPHRLTMDHVIPISKGGAHTKENVLPVCAQCNRAKGTKTRKEFLSLVEAQGGQDAYGD